MLRRVPYPIFGTNRRGISVEELHARLQEQQREKERKKAFEAEAHRAVERTPVKDSVREPPAHQLHSPPGLSVRKDSSPIKVHDFRCLHSVGLICARVRLDIAFVRNTQHEASIIETPHRGTSLCPVDSLSCLAVGRDRPRVYLRISSARDL